MNMIKSFRGRWAESVFLRLECQGFPESIQRINDRWRICFDWQDGDAFDVEIVDYH